MDKKGTPKRSISAKTKKKKRCKSGTKRSSKNPSNRNQNSSIHSQSETGGGNESGNEGGGEPSPKLTEASSDPGTEPAEEKQQQNEEVGSGSVRTKSPAPRSTGKSSATPSVTSKSVTKDETMAAYKEQQRLQRRRAHLKHQLQYIRRQTFTECAKILNAVLTYGEAKSKGQCIPPIPDVCGARVIPLEDLFKGCSGQCGGYTPGGANKLNIAKAVSQSEKYSDCPVSDQPFISSEPKQSINMPEVKQQSKKSLSVPKASIAKTGSIKSGSQKSVSTVTAASTRSGSSRRDASVGLPCGSHKSSCAESHHSKPEEPQINEVVEKTEFRPSVRILGELAFQLERRILDYVFGIDGSNRRRFYGYTVSNICYMMEKESKNPNGENDIVGRTEMTCRLRKMLCALEKYGYNIKVHADFAQELVNKYGLLPCPPDEDTVEMFGLNDPCAMNSLISRLSPRQSEVHNLNILLNCLAFLSSCDGRPLFVW